MARVQIPIQALPAHGATLDALTWTSGDATNDHYFDNTSGNVILFMRNLDSGSHTCTVVSVADGSNRTKDTTMTPAALAASVMGLALAGPFPAQEFNQLTSLGRVFVDGTDYTSCKFAAVQFTPSH